MKFLNFKFLSILVALFVVTQVAVPVKSFAGGASRPSYASGPCPCAGSAGNGSLASRGSGNSGSLFSGGGIGGFFGDIISLPFRAVGAVGGAVVDAGRYAFGAIGSLFGGGSNGNGRGTGSNGGASMSCINNGFSCVDNGSRNVARNVACATPGACATGSCYPSGGSVPYAQPNGGGVVAYAQPNGGYNTGSNTAYPTGSPTIAPVYNDIYPAPSALTPSSTVCPDPAATAGAASIAI